MLEMETADERTEELDKVTEEMRGCEIGVGMDEKKWELRPAEELDEVVWEGVRQSKGVGTENRVHREAKAIGRHVVKYLRWKTQ